MAEPPWTAPVRFRVDRALEGERLARAVARAGGAPSVRAAKALVDLGRVFRGDRREMKASAPVRAGEWIEVYPDRAPAPSLGPGAILHAGTGWLAVDKPPGVAVQGADGRCDETLAALLSARLPGEGGGGAGGRFRLVHRLDRDTSGVLRVARCERARLDLERQFLEREVSKRYAVLVQGSPDRERFRREAPVAPRRPVGEGGGGPAPGREGAGRRGRRRGPDLEAAGAVTEFRVTRRFAGAALLEARPLTGRTHQIRIHLEPLALPALGDPLYGPRRCTDPLSRAAPRQMLHAAAVTLRDPDTGERVTLRAPLPGDMERVLRWLRSQGA